MKKQHLLTLMALLFACLSAQAQTSYRISGKIHTDKEVNKIYLYKLDGSRKLLDSANIKDGNFLFTGKTEAPFPASIQVQGIRRSQELYLENTNIQVQLYENWKQPNSVIGGIENSIKKSYERDCQSLLDTLTKIGRGYAKADEEGKVKLGIEMQQFNQQMDSIRASYLIAFPQSLAILDWYKPSFAVMNYNQLQEVYHKFDSKLKGYNTYQNLEKYLQKKKSQYLVGQLAPEISSKTQMSKKFKLTQLKGKLVLLDFWASWCAPCRIANRKLVSTYQKYKDKGFEVVSYSMDNKEKPWLDAIQKDGIPWIQISDLTGFDGNAVAKDYHVKGLPTLFLIDETGKVVQQHIDHEQLLDYLKNKYDH